MDKFGSRVVLVFSSMLVTIGQAIFAFGVGIKSFYISLIGRTIFGCAGENLDLAQSIIVIGWFSGKELSMAFGLNSIMSLLGSVLNDSTEPILYAKTNSVSLGLWIGFIICFVSLTPAFFLVKIDKKRDTMMGTKEKSQLPDRERFKFQDLQNLNYMFWILVFNNICIESSVFCFTYIASGYFQQRFSYTSIESGRIMSTTFFTAAFLTPLFGIVSDKIGKRAHFLIISGIFITVFHGLFIITPDVQRPLYPFSYFILLGLGYSIYATVFWASVAYVVDSKIVGTAYGIAYSISNIALVIFPLVAGYVQELTIKDYGYLWVSILLASMGLIGIVTGVIIYIQDIKSGGILNSCDPITAKNNYINKSKRSLGSFAINKLK